MIPRTGRFSRADRLRRSREFQDVSSRGRRAASSAYVVLVAPADERSSGSRPRLGVTVSRRVGNAVVRNRIKRRIREWFRSVRGELAPAGDIVVIARSQAPKLEFEATCSLLTCLVQRACTS